MFAPQYDVLMPRLRKRVEEQKGCIDRLCREAENSEGQMTGTVDR
jgi:hypothetical protein